MKKVNIAFYLLISILLCFSCKKETAVPDAPDPIDTVVAYKTREVKISLPEGNKADLSKYTVHSISVNTPVTVDRKSKAAYNQGYPGIAYVFDEQNRLVLAGFLTDTSGTISPASTARVLLYFGYGLMLQQYDLTTTFLKEIDAVKGTQEWLADFETQFKNDPLILNNGGYAAPLRAAIHKMSAGRKINAPVNGTVVQTSQLKSIADLEVVANEKKSGLQISSDELSKLTFGNEYRRRAHAFLYKVKSVVENQTTPIVKTIEYNSFADFDNIIDPVGGFTSFSGVLGAWIEDKDMEFAVMNSGPVDIKLDDNETEAEFKLRIVGPGFPGTNGAISEQEILKQTQLEIETLALDFLLPVMLEAVGNKDDLALIDGSRHVTGPIEDFIEKTGVIMKLVPGVYEEVRKGKYDMALRKLLEGMLDQLNGEMYGNMVKLTAGVLEIIAQQKYYIPAGADVFKDADKKLKILKMIDLGLFANDIARMGIHIAESSQLEEWTVRARAPKVTLTPEKSEVVPLQQQKITCEIKNFAETGGDTHAFYEWKTSGKYGKLSDTKGHTNLVSFASADHEVFYYSNAKLEDLTDGDNLEYIYVTASFAGTIIGRDTVVINVKKETTTFTLGFTENTGYTTNWVEIVKKNEYTISNPFYTTEFKHRENAKTYTVKIIRKDGTKGAPATYYPSDFVKNGIFYYKLYVGSLYIVKTYDLARAELEVDKQKKLLADVGHKGIEVTVNY